MENSSFLIWCKINSFELSTANAAAERTSALGLPYCTILVICERDSESVTSSFVVW